MNGSRVEFEIDNGVTPNVDKNILQMLVSDSWVDIQELGVDGIWYEYEIKSDTATSFRVLAFSPEGGYTASDTGIYTVIVYDTELITADYTQKVVLINEPSKNYATTKEIISAELSGRLKEVAFIGTLQSNTINFGFEIDDPDKLEILRSIVANGTKVLIRDSRKRVVWGFIGSLSESDDILYTRITISNFVEVTR